MPERPHHIPKERHTIVLARSLLGIVPRPLPTRMANHQQHRTGKSKTIRKRLTEHTTAPLRLEETATSTLRRNIDRKTYFIDGKGQPEPKECLYSSKQRHSKETKNGRRARKGSKKNRQNLPPPPHSRHAGERAHRLRSERACPQKDQEHEYLSRKTSI